MRVPWRTRETEVISSPNLSKRVVIFWLNHLNVILLVKAGSNDDISVMQINLHRCKAATDKLHRIMGKEDLDVKLVYEPWFLDKRVRGLNSSNLTLLTPRRKGKIRRWFLWKKDINIFLTTSIVVYYSKYSVGKKKTMVRSTGSTIDSVSMLSRILLAGKKENRGLNFE